MRFLTSLCVSLLLLINGEMINGQTTVGFSNISSDPCYNYESLDRPWRANNESGDYICDESFSWNGWYRLFYYGMNIQMSETCVSSYTCNTGISLWLNGTHPQIEDGVVTREVCGGGYSVGCCDYKTNPIRVKACLGNYYVYELVKPQIGCSGYCTDVRTISQPISTVNPNISTGSSNTSNYDPCSNYNILDNYRRSTLNYWSFSNGLDDTRVEWDGWYRLFINGASAQMPEWCFYYMTCGGFSSLWLGGSHPRLEDGVVTREVYGGSRYQCSYYRSEPIQVKACPGNYYVYKLTRPTLSIPDPVYCAVLLATPSVDPCYNYTSLDEPWRATGHSNIGMCDYNVEWNGWYRMFYNGQNTQMTESCVNHGMCGTHYPLSLNGPHPQLEDGVVLRQVCFSEGGCCAYRSHPIRVKACPGNYYVYEFVKPMFCGAYCVEIFYPFGSAAGDTINAAVDDGNSSVIQLLSPFLFFGRTYQQIYVNNNGHLTFNQSSSVYVPYSFPARGSQDIIAGLWTNIDNRQRGVVSYQQFTSRNVLTRANRDINTHFPNLNFTASWVFVATWDKVPYFNLTNTETSFQVVLISGRNFSFILMNYGDIAVTGHPVQAGYDTINSTHYFVIPGSINGSFISNLRNSSNVDVPGRWVFRVDGGPGNIVFSNISSDPCYNYTSLDRPWRANNESGVYVCDESFSWNGWYRLFYNGMNIQMSETCVSTRTCNTDISLWLNGTHPQIEDGVVTREVCGNYYWGGCCYYKTNPIRVKACPGNYYVYELVKPQSICSGYCTDVSTISRPISTISPNIITGSSNASNYDPCNNYNILDNYRRSTLNYWSFSNGLDDTRVEWDGWYRLFINGASAQMPEWCFYYMTCGGFSSLYLGGSHPRLEDGVVTREVYGSRYQCSYYRSEPIQVKACPGNYYVYKLTRPTLSIPDPVYCAVLLATPSVDPCYNYTSLDEPWRATGHSNIGMCDYNVEWNGWYRMFYNGQNTQMTESCVNHGMCGTHYPLSLNGPHPQLEDGVVLRQVCFSEGGCCASRSHPIRVKACPGNYYVYEFVKPMFCGAYCVEIFYPFGSAAGDTINAAVDDGSSSVIQLLSPFLFFSRTYQQIYVNNNGHLTFDQSSSAFVPYSFPARGSQDIIAGLWTNLDNRQRGVVSYQQFTSGNVLTRANRDINTHFPNLTFTASWVFVATWDKVAYFNLTNTETSFQVVLISGGDFSFILMNYGDIAVTGHPVQAGYDTINSTHYFVIPGSINGSFISNLRNSSNVDVPGRWIFRVDGGPRNSILNNNVVGLRVRLSSFLDLTQISTEIVLQQIKQELVKYGLPNNIELKLRKLQKIKP